MSNVRTGLSFLPVTLLLFPSGATDHVDHGNESLRSQGSTFTETPPDRGTG